jgi:integrase
MSVRRRQWKDTSGSTKEAWVVDVVFEHPDGRVEQIRKTSPVPTRRGAEQYERELRQALLDGSYGKEVAPTLEEFEEKFIAHAEAARNKPRTIEEKKSVIKQHLVPLLGTKRLDTITEADIMRLKKRLAERKAKTTNNVLAVLSSLLRVAVEEYGVLDRMPCRIELLKVPPPPFRFYEVEEYEALLLEAAKLDPRVQLMVLLGGDAGLRCGEMIALEWGDIDFKRNLITVARSESKDHVTLPKGGRPRTLEMTDALASALRAQRGIAGRVFHRDDGEHARYRTFARWLRRAQKAAGLEVNGALHILRHTFCSHMAMLGAPVLAIKEAAGHVSLETTTRYLHLSPKVRAHAIAMLNSRSTLTAHEGTSVEPKK